MRSSVINDEGRCGNASTSERHALLAWSRAVKSGQSTSRKRRRLFDGDLDAFSAAGRSDR
jgi:hypothetical protein